MNVYMDEYVWMCERFHIVCMVYVSECMYECERGSILYAWCMWVNVCMNVWEVLYCMHGVCEWMCVWMCERFYIVYMMYVSECMYACVRGSILYA